MYVWMYVCIVTLKSLEDNIVKYIRNWFGLNKSSNRDIMFIPKKLGGSWYHGSLVYLHCQKDFFSFICFEFR